LPPAKQTQHKTPWTAASGPAAATMPPKRLPPPAKSAGGAYGPGGAWSDATVLWTWDGKDEVQFSCALIAKLIKDGTIGEEDISVRLNESDDWMTAKTAGLGVPF